MANQRKNATNSKKNIDVDRKGQYTSLLFFYAIIVGSGGEAEAKKDGTTGRRYVTWHRRLLRHLLLSKPVIL